MPFRSEFGKEHNRGGEVFCQLFPEHAAALGIINEAARFEAIEDWCCSVTGCLRCSNFRTCNTLTIEGASSRLNGSR